MSLPAVDIISFWGVSLSYLKSTHRETKQAQSGNTTDGVSILPAGAAVDTEGALWETPPSCPPAGGLLARA